eukprot:jgi/Mesen1/9719/ME000693S09272
MMLQSAVYRSCHQYVLTCLNTKYQLVHGGSGRYSCSLLSPSRNLVTLKQDTTRVSSEAPLRALRANTCFRSTGESRGQTRIVCRVSASEAMEASDTTSNKPFAVLFVCLGNICRSPSAEAVFVHLIQQKGLESKFKVDSAGTIGYHEGEPADSRMRRHASQRGIQLTSISRPIRRSDFEEFDLILAMDEQNKIDIFRAFEKWDSKEPLPAGSKEKVVLMCSYCTKFTTKEVPDPYYGGAAGFETVLDLLEDACGGLLASIMAAP